MRWGGGERGDGLLVTAGVEANLHAVRRSRFDPYLGLGLGYMFLRVEERNANIGTSSGSVLNSLSRGYVGPTLGFDIYVARRVSLGPQLRVVVPFAGQLCTETDLREETTGLRTQTEGCDSVADLDSEVRNDFAIPWSAQFAVTAVF